MKIHMKNLVTLLVLSIIGCTEQPKTAPTTTDPVVIKADSISEVRTEVKKAPIASFVQPVPDELNDWKFAVEIYETERRFHYTVRMQYKELRVRDSVNIPNLGIEPTVQIQKDAAPFSCTIGFLDKKGNFKPLTRANIKGDQLKFKTVASYAVGAYRTAK